MFPSDSTDQLDKSLSFLKQQRWKNRLFAAQKNRMVEIDQRIARAIQRHQKMNHDINLVEEKVIEEQQVSIDSKTCRIKSSIPSPTTDSIIFKEFD